MMTFKLELPYRVKQHGCKASQTLLPADWMERVLMPAKKRLVSIHEVTSMILSRKIASTVVAIHTSLYGALRIVKKEGTAERASNRKREKMMHQ